MDAKVVHQNNLNTTFERWREEISPADGFDARRATATHTNGGGRSWAWPRQTGRLKPKVRALIAWTQARRLFVYTPLSVFSPDRMLRSTRKVNNLDEIEPKKTPIKERILDVFEKPLIS